MYSVQLNSFELKKFLKYLGEMHHTQPHNSNIKDYIASYKKSKKKCLIYPSYNTYDWYHNDDVFKIKFLEEGKVQASQDGLEYFMRIFVYHEELDKIQQFLENVFNFISEENDEGKVKLYINKCNQYHAGWETFNCVDVQTLDTIFIDKKLKDSIIEYLDRFLASKDKYSKFGRNFKTNLLLTGIPGSGKTSLCKALAKKYGYSIYIMNFNKSMTDSYLIDLTSDVKDNSIILYEDIDAYFTERKSHDINVSFSCLINILDGTLSKGSGNINIITTNYPDRLDSALLRPGRIDKIINFDYPKKDEIKEAFNSLIGTDKNFEKFYGHIKNMQVSMATIIDYLFRNPDNYLENIKELITQVNYIHQFTKEETSSKLYS